MTLPQMIALLVIGCVIVAVLRMMLALMRMHGERPQTERDRQDALFRELVTPVTAKLKEVEDRLILLDKERAQSAGALTAQIEALRRSGELVVQSAGTLTKALREPHGRGQWGEMQLRRVVEMAGMAEHCRDFSVQNSVLTAEQRRLRPDMVVHLPAGRCVVIDAKTVWSAYIDACEAPDDEVAAPHLRRHAQQVRDQVTLLAGKGYERSVDGAMPDLVVLFLPAEHLFSAALKELPALLEESFAKGVIIASPTTLITLLHAVAQGWKEERLADNAAQIAALGRELHERVVTMARHFQAVGRHLDQATDAYNRAVGSLESRVLATARKFEQLDVAGAKSALPPVEGAASVSRRFSSPELIAEIDVPSELRPMLRHGGEA